MGLHCVFCCPDIFGICLYFFAYIYYLQQNPKFETNNIIPQKSCHLRIIALEFNSGAGNTSNFLHDWFILAINMYVLACIN